MSYDFDGLKYIKAELARYFPEPPVNSAPEIWDNYEEELDARARRALSELPGNAEDWVFVESYEEVEPGKNLEVRLFWRRKS